jgi:hypothetical protein
LVLNISKSGKNYHQEEKEAFLVPWKNTERSCIQIWIVNANPIISDQTKKHEEISSV